jgi:hypothetical protein
LTIPRTAPGRIGPLRLKSRCRAHKTCERENELRSLRRPSALLGHDLSAEHDTFVADRNRRRRTADQGLNLAVGLAAERASKIGAIDWRGCRLGFVSAFVALVDHAAHASCELPREAGIRAINREAEAVRAAARS